MRVLVACEFSGIVRDAFIKAGHDAYSCDLPEELAEGIHKDKHIYDDVLKHLDVGWDLLIAHPPCTRLCNSGVRWLNERNLWEDMYEGCKFFNDLQHCAIPLRCVENPIPHRYARDLIGAYTQKIQPWQFGEPQTKATCLWLHGLPRLKPTDIVLGREEKVWKMSPGKNRAKDRSRFFPGIAEAMAQQWGNL